MSHYGVPQSRKRLILRDVRTGELLGLPAKAPRAIGWYEAIEDLIPTLKKSQLAPWQIARLGRMDRTCLVDSQETNGTRLPSDAEASVTSSVHKGMPRAVLIDDQQGKATKHGRTLAMFGHATPSMTITGSSAGHALRILEQGNVVKLSMRALARLQTFPDSYKLSGNNKLDATIIGNACPPLFAKQVVATLIQATS